MSNPLYCGKYGCDNGVVWMMSEFPVPCEDCRKLRETARRKKLLGELIRDAQERGEYDS